ncbi:hypothetical protein AB0N38_10735 [Micromonospora aurantiaca]|uniref:hypothetical protein n=1 Tax=Micromonospora aurantiaca (nom. illeg.) TaxID=47850 RepID=UPI003413F664
MPTFELVQRFLRDWARLTPEQQEAFRHARKGFVDDLRAGNGFRKGLRVKRVQGTRDVWEMTWAPDGRATWQYGDEQKPGEAHVIWRRIGTHTIFDMP